MARAQRPKLPLAAIRDMLRWFKAAKVSGAVIVGVAVLIQGHPRFTHDLDALVVLDRRQWPAFVAHAAEFGFAGRVSDVLAFAANTRMLLLRHKASGIPLDISLGSLEFEEQLIARATPVKLGRLIIPVATPEDLIILKAIAQRPQDLADIDNLLAAHPRLDVSHVRRTLEAFAAILERPEIVDPIEPLLARHAKQRRK